MLVLSFGIFVEKMENLRGRGGIAPLNLPECSEQ